MSEIEIEIVDEDEATIEAIIRVSDIKLQIIANVRLDENTVILYDLHIDGPGPNALGMGQIRRIVDHVMEKQNVHHLEIHGFRRTTGANPGHIPRPLKFRRS